MTNLQKEIIYQLIDFAEDMPCGLEPIQEQLRKEIGDDFNEEDFYEEIENLKKIIEY